MKDARPAIFVDAARGDDRAPGSRDRPVRTFAAAFELARSGTYRKLVILSDMPDDDPLNPQRFIDCGISEFVGFWSRAQS